MARSMKHLVEDPKVQSAAADLLGKGEALAQLCVEIQQIAAPTGAEEERARWIAERFHLLGLADIRIDATSNVYGRLPGKADVEGDHIGKTLLISAHTDTVFPAGTELTVRIDEDEHRIYGPGIGDNSAGVAGLITLAESLVGISPPPSDIWFVANTGEEGLGDLRGMRAAVERLQGKIGAAIVIEGMGLGRIVHEALGSRRYRITAHAPGGHSWSNFGTASAIHALVLLASEIVQLKVPASPRTTFNIGKISGGTSVNSIAQEATLELDLRSADQRELRKLVKRVYNIVQRFQSSRWQRWGIRIEMETIGDRPGGAIDPDHPLVAAASSALAIAGLTENADLRMSSTDANVPLSLGIPAICVGITHGGDAHRLEEWIDPRPMPQGMQHLLLLTWWASEWLAGE